MEKQLIAERFARARKTYDREARVQYKAAERMLRLLQPHIKRTGLDILEVGCGTGIYSRLLCQEFQPSELWLNDLCPEMEQSLQDLLGQPHVHFLPGDAETLRMPPRIHVITSCSTLQWFSQPQQFFRQCQDILPPNGILAFSTFGPQNLQEIRTITGHGLHYFTTHEWGAMLPPSLRLRHISEETATLHFPTPTDVLRHLKLTGVTGTEKRIWTRTHLQAFAENYIRLFGQADGQVTLTYHPIYIIAQKADDGL